MIGDRWGVTDEETSRRYPCDDVVTTPALQAWRGVHVRASPARTWGWVLVPHGDGTRLLMKIVAARTFGLGPLLSIGDLVMARRQLLNFKHLAESVS